MDKTQLVEEIQKTFQNTTYPGDNYIVSKGMYDNEVAECEAKFMGKKWNEVDWHLIDNEGWASGVAFLTNEAYRYYLPAYMVAIVEHYVEMGNSIDTILTSLIMPKEIYINMPKEYYDNTRTSTQRFLNFAQGFTPPQKRTIRLFLEWLDQVDGDNFFSPDDPKTALERYWNKF